MLDITQIPAPRVPIIDNATGLMSMEWFRFFNGLYTVVGANQNVLQPVNGGTGVSATPTDGQLLIGNSVGYTLNTLTPGAGIGVTNAPGIITIVNAGVLSWSAGITGLTPIAATTGAITLSGVLNVASGGTNASTASITSFNNITGYTATGATGTTSTNLVFSASPVFSGSVGIGAAPNASAILDAQSTTLGVRFPNMTTAQKNAIGTPAAGLVIFDTTLAKLCVYSGAAWQTITSV
jgi:hypothetical protein